MVSTSNTSNIVNYLNDNWQMTFNSETRQKSLHNLKVTENNKTWTVFTAHAPKSHEWTNVYVRFQPTIITDWDYFLYSSIICYNIDYKLIISNQTYVLFLLCYWYENVLFRLDTNKIVKTIIKWALVLYYYYLVNLKSCHKPE